MNEIEINPDRINLDEAYMQMAEIWGKRSKANRLQVGALIVKDRQIISDGYNGMPAGDEDDTCEFIDENGELRTKPEALHAESNALMKISENGGVGAQGGTLYTVYSPCFECSKLIKQAKIQRVVFRHWYRDTAGVDMLHQRGVKVEQLPGSKAPAPTINPDVDRLRSLAEVAARPAPVQAPDTVQTPPAATVREPSLMSQVAKPAAQAPVIIDDVAAALAAAGLVLDNGVPVATRAPTKSTAPAADDGSYRSNFF